MYCIILKWFTKQKQCYRIFWRLFFNGIKANLKATKGTGLKILTPKPMLQRLTVALAQVKAGNNSKNSLNEIRQIVYSLYQTKEITKKSVL